MGFTIEDMNLMAKDRYHMEFIAGKRGWVQFYQLGIDDGRYGDHP